MRYLEELERDLVKAVDRRNAAPARRWHWRPRRRYDWSPAVTAAAVLLAIAVVLALVRSGPGEQHAVSPSAVEGNQRPAPIPPHTPFRLVGTVTRIDPTTWRGQARGPGGVGTLTLSGTIDLTARPCCDTARRKAPYSRHVIQFTWTSPSGTISGSIKNRTYRRPHGRFVWDGLGRVTGATGALGRYRGRRIGIAGETRTATPDRARIIL